MKRRNSNQRQDEVSGFPIGRRSLSARGDCVAHVGGNNAVGADQDQGGRGRRVQWHRGQDRQGRARGGVRPHSREFKGKTEKPLSSLLAVTQTFSFSANYRASRCYGVFSSVEISAEQGVEKLEFTYFAVGLDPYETEPMCFKLV